MVLNFNENTPQGNDPIDQTQPLILQNFQSLDFAFNGQTGAGSGGGDFTTYNVQNTTTNFVAKPVNPIGTFYTVPSSVGNPELGWINNVNSVGAGPYTGTRITGGGITPGAWFNFTSLTNASSGITATNAYNIASIVTVGTTCTITFTRAFVNTDYAPVFSNNGFNDGTIRKIVVTARNTNSIVFISKNASNSQTEIGTCSLIVFGYLV